MQEFLLALPVLLFSMVAHEYAHARTALSQGDDTALLLGRLTLNPIKHIDPWMTILLPCLLWFGSGGQVVFGGAKPVPVDPAKFHHYRRGDLIVSSAGIVANLLLVVACLGVAMAIGMLGRAAPDQHWLDPLQRMMFWGIRLNLLLAFFNLIPIPPLDGSHLLYHLLPAGAMARYRAVAPYGILVLMGLMFLAPNVLSILLLPAFALSRVAMHVAEPYTLKPFPIW